MKSMLTYIDIFGTKFHFLTYQKMKFQTWIGGIITIITFLLTIILIFIFEEDFFFRKNPVYYYSNIIDKYEKINLSKEKVMIAFRLEDKNGMKINSDNILYPMIYYYSSSSNTNNNYSEKYIPYRKCKEKDFEDNENLILKYGELYCIEWENLTFGGNWGNDFLYYFEIRLFYCKNGENYSFNNSNCTSIESLKNFFSNQSVFISIYYNTVNFRVNNLKKPFERKHKIYLSTLNHKLRKIERTYLRKQILNDDQGFLFSDKKQKSIWAIDSINTEYNYFTEDEILNEGFSTMIYSFNIYMQFEKMVYTRKYTKIQDIIAMLSGLLTFFNFLGKIISDSINLSFRKLKIIEMFFNVSTNNTKKKRITFSNLAFDATENSFNKLINSNSTDLKKKKYNSNINNVFLFNSKSNYINIPNTTSEGKKYKTQISTDLHFFKDNIKMNNNIKYKNKHNDTSLLFLKFKNGNLFSKKNPNDFSIKTLVTVDLKKKMKTICCCNYYSNNKNKLKKKKTIYELTNDIYDEKCDLFFYFLSLKEIRFLKEIFLNPHQNLSIKFTKKLNVVEKENLFDIKKNENKREKIIEYFKRMFRYKKNSKLDNFIFEKLDDDIKTQILAKK